MKHYAFRVTASEHPDAVPTGGIWIDATSKDDLWDDDTGGSPVRYWSFLDARTGDMWTATGVVLVRVCSTCCTDHNRASPHGHDGDHGADAPRWVPEGVAA